MKFTAIGVISINLPVPRPPLSDESLYMLMDREREREREKGGGGIELITYTTALDIVAVIDFCRLTI